jgi:hypothetical protein
MIEVDGMEKILVVALVKKLWHLRKLHNFLGIIFSTIDDE